MVGMNTLQDRLTTKIADTLQLTVEQVKRTNEVGHLKLESVAGDTVSEDIQVNCREM